MGVPMPVQIEAQKDGEVAQVTILGSCTPLISASFIELTSLAYGRPLRLEGEPECVTVVRHTPSPPPNAPRPTPPSTPSGIDVSQQLATTEGSSPALGLGLGLGLALFSCGVLGTVLALLCLRRRAQQAKQIEKLRDALEQAPAGAQSSGLNTISGRGQTQAAVTKMVEAQGAAMDALKAIFLASSPGALRKAIAEAEGTRLVPAEGMEIGRERLKILEAQENSEVKMSQQPDEELQAQILQLMGEQQERIDLTKRLQAQVDSLQADHEAIEAENRRLREAVLSRDATLSRGAGLHEDEQQILDREALERYHSVAEQLVEKLTANASASPQDAKSESSKSEVSALYAERDLHLFRLSDNDFQAEYLRLTKLYLEEDTIAAVRGMAEMVLTKMAS